MSELKPTPPPFRSNRAGPATLAPLDRRVALVGVAVFGVLMALSPWYGFHRDELYFLDAGRHLQGGYVDQPFLAPLLARVSIELFGVSAPGLRLWPAVAAGVSVVLAAMISREFGGAPRAQLLAAVGVATMPVLLAIDHLEGPTAFDMVAWAGLAFIAVRVGRTGDQRWWVAAGLVLGLGLANKHSIGLFALALAIGTLVCAGRRDIANRWFLLGAMIAVAFTLPDLIWQAGHGWATVSMTRELNAENGGASHIANWIVGQLLMTLIPMIWVWARGLRWLWRSSRPTWRGLSWAYGLLFVFFMLTTGAKIYYLAGAYVYLIAAGAVTVDATLLAAPSRRRAFAAVTAISTLLALPLVLPVLPPADVGWTYSVNQAGGESIGWPELIDTVHAAWNAIPAAQRRAAVIYAADYGEAGAINELGRRRGLPSALSSDNSEWWWGPGDPDATTVLAVAPGPMDFTGYRTYLRRYFGSVRTIATLRNSDGIHNQEWGGHVYLCTRPRRPWTQIWPQLRHYG